MLQRGRGYVRQTFRRLYNQRNLVMHGGSLRSVALEATLRTAPPLVGAGLTRGCVTIADGGYTLDGHIIKGQDQPAPARWWIDPLVARSIATLERLGDHVEVVEQSTGVWVASDRLLFRLSTSQFGQAGIGREPRGWPS